MSFEPVIVQVGLSFYQQLIITLITVGASLSITLVLFYIMFRTDLFFDLMDRMMRVIGKNQNYSNYTCNCSRCQFQLRTKKGLKQWKKDHKFKKEDLI